MPWFKIDDGFWSHPKTLQLSDGAQALWMRAGSWSMHHLTDGFIPDFALPILSAKPRYVNELRSVSLWFSTKDGNQFHDWIKYQPTREQVEADRHAAAERKRKSREKSQRDTPRDDYRSSDGDTHTPTRPDPTRPTSVEDSSSEAALEKKIKEVVYPKDFSEWWLAYPRKESKGAALKAFTKAIRTVELEQLIRATQAYALSCLGMEPQFVKLPAGWLNDRKWEDEKPVAQASARSFTCSGGHDWSDGPYCLKCGEREPERDF